MKEIVVVSFLSIENDAEKEFVPMFAIPREEVLDSSGENEDIDLIQEFVDNHVLTDEDAETLFEVDTIEGGYLWVYDTISLVGE